MTALWYGILAAMLVTYVVLDGRNFGAGVLHWVVARTPAERRQVIAAIGPLWSWHEVWLVGAGGVMAMSFPQLMAVGFPGYYLALFLILWCLVLRGVSIEVGGHLDDPLWCNGWDAVFTVSNVLLAVLFGVALGNIVRGVPLTEDRTFHLSFFTDFHTRGAVGLLDWYTLCMAPFCVLTLTAHGATYLVMRTEGAVRRRAARLARTLWLVAAPAFGVVSLLTWFLRPELLRGLVFHPAAWVPLLVTAAGAWALWTGLRWGHERRAFLGSTSLLFGLLIAGAAALFPVLLFSTLDTAHALTADDCAAPAGSLRVSTAWWFAALALALGYLFIIRRYYQGKVSLSKDSQSPY